MPDSLLDFDFVEALHRMFGWEREQIDKVIEQAQTMDMLLDLIDALRADDRDHVNDILRHLQPEQGKYNMANEELSENFGIGDEVRCYKKHTGKIKVPNGPGKTVGVMLDGELQMVEKKHVKPVSEGVLGMSALPGIQRMRELAGMPSLKEDEMSAMMGDHPPMAPKPALPPAPMGDSPDAPMDAGMLGGDDLSGDDLGGDDLGGGLLGGGVPTGLGGMDAASPAPAPVAPVGAGPDLGMDAGMSAIDPAPLPVNSPAYSQIEDALNNIQRQLTDIKLSEYKPLVKRMQDLAAQAQQMGKEYLGEAIRRAEAKKKKALTERKSFRDYLKK